MEMLYCFINNIHVDYAELLWEGFHYSLKNPATMLPYPRFTKLIASHYMTALPEISKRAHDRYRNLKDDVMIKSIFNSGKNKTIVGMKILDWMITEEMKLMENYRLYVEVFGVDVPTTQSQPTVPTQGTDRTTSAPRTPTLLLLKENRVLNEVLQDTLQVSLAEKKSHDEDEARENMEQVKQHLMAEEIEKLVEGSENVAENVTEYVDENVEVSSSPPRNDDSQSVPGTRRKTRQWVLKLKRREKGKEIEESRTSLSPTPIRSHRIHSNLISSDIKKLRELTKTDPTSSSSIPSSSSPSHDLSVSNRLLSLFKAKPGRFRRYKSFFQELQEIMMEALPKLVDERIKRILQTQVPLHVAQGLILEIEKNQADVEKMIADAIKKERENLRSDISSQPNDAIANQIASQVDLSVQSYMLGHILHAHPTQATPASAQDQQYQLYLTMKDDPQFQQTNLPIWIALNYKFKRMNMSSTTCRPSAVFPRDQDDPHDDAHLKGDNNDDVILNEKVSQELVDEMSQTVDEAKLRKMVDEMLRQQCTSGDEHQYHIDQMHNFFKSDIMWESRKEILVPPKGNSGPKKIALSLHKFPAVNFPDDDIEERTFRWVDKIVKRFNPYALYGELGYEHKFVTEIVARRANGRIVSIIESDYKNLNKNDIEDMYLLIINHKVEDYSETGFLWSLSVFIRKGLKRYNNDVKYGYVTRSLSKEDVEYLQLFAEEIEERLKYHDQMRRWEMYVNRRPLGPSRERLE
ncbi:hypothetical protein Tco_1202066 [Tanacetum coccineum]